MFSPKRERERESREREIFYYRLRTSNMTYETKNITFQVIHVKVSSDSQCSRTLSMNVAIESAHCGCERISSQDWAWSKMCGKHGRIWSKADHCIKVWYLDSRTCLGQSVHSRPLSSLLPQRSGSHRNACELSWMNCSVWIESNRETAA